MILAFGVYAGFLGCKVLGFRFEVKTSENF